MSSTTGNLPGAGALPSAEGKVIVAASITPSSMVIHCCSEKDDG